MKKEWYVLQAYSGMENKVKELIEEKAKMLSLNSFFGKIVIPEIEEIDYVNRKIEKIFVSPDATLFIKNRKDIKKGEPIAKEPSVHVKKGGTITESKNYRKITVETEDKRYSKIFLIPEKAGVLTGLRAGKKVKSGTPFTKDGTYESDVDGEIGSIEKVKRIVIENNSSENDIYVVPAKIFDSKLYRTGTRVEDGEEICSGYEYKAKSSGRIDVKEHLMRKEIKIIKTSRTKLFPGYIFIEMMFIKEAENIIKSIPYVSTFLNIGGKPIKLRKNEIRAILRLIGEETYTEKKAVVRIDYEIGEHIKIISGPFELFNGRIMEIDKAKQEVKIAVTIFGRETKVEVSLSDIEKIID
ncbi:MAG: antitermination protein NusG [Thermotogae bacterium]|nr:antitermination protein NusG [Thermotogota bacterium]